MPTQTLVSRLSEFVYGIALEVTKRDTTDSGDVRHELWTNVSFTQMHERAGQIEFLIFFFI